MQHTGLKCQNMFPTIFQTKGIHNSTQWFGVSDLTEERIWRTRLNSNVNTTLEYELWTFTPQSCQNLTWWWCSAIYIWERRRVQVYKCSPCTLRNSLSRIKNSGVLYFIVICNCTYCQLGEAVIVLWTTLFLPYSIGLALPSAFFQCEVLDCHVILWY